MKISTGNYKKDELSPLKLFQPMGEPEPRNELRFAANVNSRKCYCSREFNQVEKPMRVGNYLLK